MSVYFALRVEIDLFIRLHKLPKMFLNNTPHLYP